MQRSHWTCPFFVAALWSMGCGEKKDSSSGSCRDLVGQWVMVEHCEDDVLGTEYDVLQDGCDLDVESPGPEEISDVRITADDELFFTVTDPDGDSAECVGSVTADRMAWTCGDGICDGAVERQD